MYEKPTLVPVGKGEDVILGVMSSGWDADGLFMVGDQEFAEDPEITEP